MALIEYGIILAALLAVIALTWLTSLVLRNVQKAAVERVAGGGSIIIGAAEPIPGEVSGNTTGEQATLREIGIPSSLPDEAKSILMNAVWYRCENPKCNYTQYLDVYQIVSREKGGSNALDNLIVLCPDCLANAHGGEIAEDTLHSWIQGRVERFKFDLDWPHK